MAERTESYSFTSAAELAEFVPPNEFATPGTSAYVIETDTGYVFTIADSGDVPVAGYGGAYWTEDTSNATVTPTPDAVPKSDEDGQLDAGWIPGPAAFPDYDVFACPEGDDVTGDGSTYRPVRTIYKCIEVALANGGGNVNFADDTEIGGPVPGQGIWLRNDDINVPGFLQLQNRRIRLVGNGRSGGQFTFARPGSASVFPTDGNYQDATKPQLWIVGSEVPIDVEFLKLYYPDFYGYAAPVRLGWDYVRNNSGAVENIAITSATRAAGSTTFTVDISGTQSFTVVSASRASNIVTAVVQMPAAMKCGPWGVGSPIRVVTSDANFPSVDTAIIQHQDLSYIASFGGTVIITYAQSGANVSSTPVTGGTIRSHGCTVKDRISLASVDAQFPLCCMMRVTSATVDTITVRDPYGYGSRSASVTRANIGTLVKQNRGRIYCSAVSFGNCDIYGGSISTDDQPHFGPTIDIGCVSANPIRFSNCYFSGGENWQWQNVDPSNVDLDRTKVAIFGDPGSGGAGGTATVVYNCQSQDGCIRFYGGNGASGGNSLTVDEFLQDSATVPQPNVVWVEGTTFDNVRVDNVSMADADLPAVSLCAGLDPQRIIVGRLDTSYYPPIISGSGMQGPLGVPAAKWFPGAGATSPWVLGWRTVWPGGLTTPHRGINRALGVTSARYENEFPALADWQTAAPFPGTVTITQDGEAPDGSMTAIKIVASEPSTVYVGDYPFFKAGSWDTGGRIMFGCWTNFPEYPNAFLGIGYYGTVVFNGDLGTVQVQPPTNAPGWQWVPAVASITDIGNGMVAIIMNVPAGTSYIWAPTLIYVPPGVNDQDAWETLMNARHQPIYLPKGLTGTMEGVKLVGHGGLGSGAAYVEGVGSGQLTVVGSYSPKRYEPVYRADGTFKGWAELINATVNP